MLNLQHVQAFVAIIDTGSFRQAARHLSLAQPTLSQWIRKLEAELGCSLVIRNHQRCVPTQQGKRFLPYAQSLLRVAISVKHRIASQQVIVGAASNIGIYIMPDKLKRLISHTPSNLQIDLVIGTNPNILSKLQTGEIDLAALEWWDQRPGFEASLWYNEPLVIIVWPNHPWANKRHISIDELATQPMLGGERGTGTGTRLTQLLHADAQRLKVSQNLGSTEAVKRAVMAGLGISLVALSSVTDELATKKLYALELQDTPLTKPLYLVTPANLPCESPVQHIACQLATIQDLGKERVDIQ